MYLDMSSSSDCVPCAKLLIHRSFVDALDNFQLNRVRPGISRALITRSDPHCPLVKPITGEMETNMN